jgi:hypothetical protein
VLAENSSSKRVAYRVSVFCSTKFRVIVVKRCRGMGANFNNATPSRPAAPVVYTVAVAELSGLYLARVVVFTILTVILGSFVISGGTDVSVCCVWGAFERTCGTAPQHYHFPSKPSPKWLVLRRTPR